MGFITNIEIENFYSIKNKIVFDFNSSKYMIQNHSDRIINFNDKYYTTVNGIYGANASGKSSILRAIIAVSQSITNSSDESYPISFKNRFLDKRKRSKVSISFVINNDEYVYELILKSNDFKNIGIYDESLYKLIENKQELVFNRLKKIVVEIDENIKKPILEKLNDKKSLIYDLMKFDIKLEEVFRFFRSIKYTTNIENAYFTNTIPSKKKIEGALEAFIDNKGLEKFIIKFINNIGIDITEFIPEYKDSEEGEKVFEKFLIKHKVSQNKEMDLILESDGTMTLIQTLIHIYFAKIENSVLIIDEFDSILHPMLVPLVNKLLIDNQIQVVYTTHNIYNMKYLYLDEVTLIEKDNKHITEVKQLKYADDIEYEDNILDLYEEGYFGGMPEIIALDTKIY